MKTVLALLVVLLAIAVPASALSIDFGRTGQTVESGYEDFSAAAPPTTLPMEYSPISRTFGTNVVTLTAVDGGGDNPARLSNANRTTAGVDVAMRDGFRAEKFSGTTVITKSVAGYDNEIPILKVEVTGLAVSTQYTLEVASWDAFIVNAHYQILRPTSGSGTTGPTVPYQVRGGSSTPVYAPADFEATASGVFTTSATGLLTFDIVYDQAASNNTSDPQAWLNAMIITQVPEPATMALVLLGGLGVLRRRR